jgi:peroxiredoxin
VRQSLCIIAALLALAAQAPADTVTGAFVDLKNAPVPEASVWLWQPNGVQFVKTTSAGVFSFKNVASGPASIVAQHDGYALTGMDLQVLGSTSLQMQMVPESSTLTLRVIDEQSHPVSGAYIKDLYIVDRFTLHLGELADHGFPVPRTDADGVVAFPGLPNKCHVALAVYHADFAETRLPYLTVTEKRQAIQLFPGVPLRGRVTSQDKKAVANARVVVYKQGSGGRRDVAERSTDPEGFYAVRVTPGEYFVEVRHPKYAAPLPPSVTVADEEPATVDVSLSTPSHLRGKIVASDGSPAPGVLVRYYMQDRFYDETLSLNDGNFDLAVPVGEGMLRVAPPPGYITKGAADMPVRLDHTVDVKIDPVVLKALPVLDGRVVDAQGTPQPNVLLSTRNIQPPFWGITDKDGRFTVQVSKPPEDGKAQFRAEHALRFMRKDFEVDLRADPKPVEVVLEDFRPELSRPDPGPGQNDLTALLDEKAPELSVDNWINSKPLTLDALKGKVVVLTLWAGFDTIGPTRDRMYELCALHRVLKGQDDIVFLGIHDNGSEPEEIQEFVNNYGIEFPVARDVEKFTTFQRYNTVVIPQTVLIDRAGRVRYFNVDGRLPELIKSLRREEK